MSDLQVAVLNKRLRGFTFPDTLSDIEGLVDPGRYEVLDHRENYPDSDTDYTQLRVSFGDDRETWICSRWRDQRYATIIDKSSVAAPHMPELGEDPFSIAESALLQWLDAFRPFRYTSRGARYPFKIPGVSDSLVGEPNLNNCCTFVEALLVKAWTEQVEAFAWDGQRHAQAMILGDDLYSPVTALLETGIATSVPELAAPPQWTVIQGWRPSRRGHTFIIVAHHPASDRVLTLESNSSYGLNGVGFRKLGPLEDYPAGSAPQRWWENAAAPTWREIARAYPQRRQAALKVREPTWAVPGP